MVSLSQSLTSVSERVERFFAPDSVRMSELRREIITPLSDIGHVVIVGGVIRDLAFYGAKARPISDIDFVVTGRTNQLDSLAERLGAVPNRFGGYGLARAGYKIDFWSLHKTWAKTHHHAKVNSPKDLIKTTFFDWDAIAYDLTTSEIFATPRYIDKLHSRILDINLLPNPSIHGNLVRALRRIIMWDVKPGRGLRRFIDEHLWENDWASILSAEEKAFSVRYLQQFRSAMDFQQKAISSRSYKIIGVDIKRQQSFDFYLNGKDFYKK